jgi:hypothetical protein
MHRNVGKRTHAVIEKLSKPFLSLNSNQATLSRNVGTGPILPSKDCQCPVCVSNTYHTAISRVVENETDPALEKTPKPCLHLSNCNASTIEYMYRKGKAYH